MNTVRLFLSNLLMLLLIAGCSSEGEFNQTSEELPLLISEKTVLDYTNTSVQTLIKGQLAASIASLDKILIYSDETCSSKIMGQALVSDFKNNGVVISTPLNAPAKIYLSTAASNDCVLIETYEHELLVPRAPVFSQTVPSSPTRITTSPGIFGLSFPESGTVEFYDDDACTNLISQGAAKDFNSVGLAVAVSENSITRIHAVAKDQNGGESACTYLTDFDHSNQLSGPPQLISLSHTSPNNESFTPIVRGSTALGTTDVGIFSDSGCVNELASGDPSDFADTGFQITALENSTISIYAKSVDDQNQPSVCALLTSFTHDNEAPANPAFTNVSPISPTNQTTQPLLTGTVSADTETIFFYDSNTCQNVIGSGSKNTFETVGVAAGVQNNDVTSIFAKSFDAAGNDSSCVSFTSYTHNTFPPNAPLFDATVPESPTNQTITPLIKGTVSNRTVSLNMYSDEVCADLVGQGTTAEYEGAGIQVSLASNASNSIYVRVFDFEGNISPCTFHTVYDHSTAVAPDPGFFSTFPASPSRISNTPTIIGTADNSIETVSLYSDALCSNSLGSGTRGQYTSSGITVNLPQNSTNDIYVQAKDEYGNDSNCTFITQYIHTTVKPLDPTYTDVTPVSPNNQSISPVLTGESADNPGSELPTHEVAFFDSPSCISKLGEGTPAEFSGAGITINVPQNAETFVYARAFDEAGNTSNCVHLTNYIHNNLQPGSPNFISVTPGSPSYSDEISLFGNFLNSPDFMDRVSMIVYSDAGCSSQVAVVNPSAFETTGVSINVPENATTDLYAVSINEVGTRSNCSSLTTFRHYDDAPQNLNTAGGLDGSVSLSWIPDTISSPTPRYSVERSLFINGPYSVIASWLASNSYKDLQVSDNTEYYYRVFASNSTGRSKYSISQNITVAAPPAVSVATLNASEGDSRITLNWSGFPQNMTYSVLRSNNFGGPFIDLGQTLTGTSYIDTGLTNEQVYYYVVKASNPSGETTQSNVASAVPKITPDAPGDFNLRPAASLDACGGARGVTTSWTASSYYSSFLLYRNNIKGAANVDLSTSSVRADRCGLAGDTLYYYRVGALWDLNGSATSDTIGFYTRSAPNFTVEPGNGEVLLSWQVPNLHTDLNGLTRRYDVYSSDDYNGDYTLLVNGTTGTSHTDILANGQGRFYYLQAYVVDGEGDKVFVGYPTQIIGARSDANPPPPTNLNISVVQNFVRLNWTASSHYNFYRVYRASNPGGPYSEVMTANSSVVTSAPVNTGMNYFRVTGVWGSFETAVSNTVSYREATITGLSGISGALDISLSWDNIAGVQDYSVLRATSKNGVYAEIATPATNSYVDSTAASGVGYYYKIKANFADATVGQESDPVAGMRTDSSTPSGLSLTIVASSLIRVEWAPVSGATLYRVTLSNTLNGTYVNRGTTFGHEFNLAGLTAGTEYFVKVTSTVGGNTFPSDAASATTFLPPAAPSGTPGDNEINLVWSPTTGAVDYDILRSTDAINYATISSNFPTTSYLDTSAVNGNIYFYKIQANFPSEQLVSVESLGISPGVTPLVPSQLHAENNGIGTEIELSWAQVAGATNYNVYLSTSAGSYGAPTRSSTATENVRVTGLNTGTTYYLVVTALIGSVESAVSNEVIVVPQLEAAAPLAKYEDSSTVEITWGAIAGATTYDLYRSVDGVDFDLLTTGLGATTFLDATVNPIKTYYYKYKGYSAAGAEMSFSQMSTGVNLSEEPQVPLGFHIFATATNAVEISWASVPNVSGYEILRGTTTSGPYATIGSILAPTTQYIDNGVVPGTRYFYVIRSLSFSDAPSPYSVEKSIELIAGPTGLAAANGPSSVDLSWNTVPGATTYNVYRSLVSSGPYGFLSNVAVASYADTDIVADETYYYVVDAVFADGSTTVLSSEESILRSGYLSLQVAIEMVDRGIASLSAAPTTFERSLTLFDDGDYDGVSSFELEVIASNFDVVDRVVTLIDEADFVVGTINVPAGTSDPTRIKAVVTPNVGAEYYRIGLEQTNVDDQLHVYGAKLLINQVNATKTKLYFPLLSSDQTVSSEDFNGEAYATNAETFSDFEGSLMYQRIATKLKKIIDYNAWEIQAVVATTGLAEGAFGLGHVNSGTIVPTTTTRFNSNNMQLAVVPFDEGVDYFGSLEEGHNYALRFKCEYNCDTGSAKIYKAGLSVKLENLASARMVQRVANYNAFINSQTDLVDYRSYVDTSLFSSPQIYFQAQVEDDPLSSGDIDLISSVQNSGSGGVSIVAGSNLFANNDDFSLMVSPPIAIPTNNNFMVRVNPAGGDLILRDASLIFEVGN